MSESSAASEDVGASGRSTAASGPRQVSWAQVLAAAGHPVV